MSTLDKEILDSAASSGVDSLTVYVPADRQKAVTRALMCSAVTLILSMLSYWICSGITFQVTVVSNRIVDYCLALAVIPLALGVVVGVFKFSRWTLLAIWPAKIGVFATPKLLIIKLGPFGCYRYEAMSLTTIYPFECSGDSAVGDYEAFLPEDQQRLQRLPTISHQDAHQSIDRTIMRFAEGTHREIAHAFRPILNCWRGENGDDSGSDRE